MSLAFAKYEGLGNDFIVVQGRSVTPEQAARLCDRHFGVGADGVLVVDAAAPSMRVINADGSEPEMCGNGIRCVALHLLRTAKLPGDGSQPIVIDTGAGPHACRLVARPSAHEARIEVAMRHASLAPDELGLRAQAPWVDAELSIEGRDLHVTAVSMGNPHLVTFDDVGEARLALGPRLGAHEGFARGANIGFARMLDRRHLELFVLERGSGWTLACGTGACAAAVAAVETGRAPRGEPIEVRLPGGTLEIVVPELGANVRMTGPARHVFDGVL